MSQAYPLSALLASPARMAVARALVATRTALTGGETARLAGVSWPQAIEALRRLTAAGLATKQRVAGGGLYTLNRGHELVRGGLVPLFGAERQLVRKTLARFLAALESLPIRAVILFGSTARASRRWQSDLDLLVVVPRRTGTLVERIQAAADAGGARAGIRLAPLVMTPREIRASRGRKRELLSAIAAEGKILAGRGLEPYGYGADA